MQKKPNYSILSMTSLRASFNLYHMATAFQVYKHL